jgi:error-prone DNA polymerase
MKAPAPALPAYAELHCLSAFSFQRGASRAKELFERAQAAGYHALAITDECTMAGIVRALEASREFGVPLIVGSEIQLDDGPKVVFLAADLAGYTTLCRWITLARRRAPKGRYELRREDVVDPPLGLLALWVPSYPPDEAEGAWLRGLFPDRLWIAVELHREATDALRLEELRGVGARLGVPLVAAGDVHMHVRRRRALQDVLTAVRYRTTVAQAGWRLFQNGERHLRSRQALSAIYPADLLVETVRIAERCTFSLEELRYTYPHELVPAGHTAASWLRHLVEDGIRWRWPEGLDGRTRDLIEHELALIEELNYPSYFLTVADIVRFARSKGILCQGRGSAANSAVCFALGITSIDPSRMQLLFERFLSRERNEPPDIDIDFEHQRREEVIQYVFERYGRDRAALTAVASSYRGRGAVRDVAKALGLPPDQVNLLAQTMERWSSKAPIAAFLRDQGFDPDSAVMRKVTSLTAELMDFPRHLSQHPGGFVISEHPLHTLVPVENAAMDDRTVVQWDKDDLDVIGLMKVDCLALGMLTAVQKTLDLLRATGRRDLNMATIPADCAKTYSMVSEADTIGVFQIESRAQMAMLPRLQPRCFYDLVIQVAIVRPGPIQGDMVHPYLRRRRGEDPIDYPPGLKHVFERTLGVPLFQEQVMQLAVDAAGFTPGEADQLRRGMAAWKRRGGLEPHRERLFQGMIDRGYDAIYAQELFDRIKGFGSYGFPESHAASFALVVYATCWLKCHEPVAYAASVINSQPMGFYTPDQILQDVRRKGTKVLPVDVRYSDWDCTLEFGDGDTLGVPAIRLGLRLVIGFSEAVAQRISAARARSAFTGVDDLCFRAQLDRKHQDRLAEAGALKGLAGHRHRARWAVSGVEAPLPLFAGIPQTVEPDVPVPLPNAAEDMLADYVSLGMTLGRHPLAFIRKKLAAKRCKSSVELAEVPHGRRVRFAGIVRLRQRPETASGITFLTLEDEHGMVNALVWKRVAEEQRRPFLESRLMAIDGRLERSEGVQHLIVHRMENYGEMLEGLAMGSRDFR